ncbi:hypothetical protein SUGI_0491660 [Cryptomeria japonica]|nr:hypothetical protein SUGI_0491660 [Cryptomeria japonica]
MNREQLTNEHWGDQEHAPILTIIPQCAPMTNYLSGQSKLVVCQASRLVQRRTMWSGGGGEGPSPRLQQLNSGRGDIRKFMSMAGGSSSQMEKQCRDQHDVIPGLRHTVWDQQDLRPKFPKIEKDESADVVVVGAGIAGISCAYNLVKEGKSVVLLEAKTRGSGMSGRTTAHLMLWYDDFYFQLEKDHGFDIAKIVAESHKRAIDFIETTVKEEGIDCHFYRLDGYLFPHDNSTEAMDLLIKEFEACKRVRLDVKMVELGNDPAYGKVGKAIQFPNSGEFHPLLYINGVADAIVRRGGRIYEKSHVFEVEKNHVKTKDGVTVTAGAVVMATYSPLNHNLAVHARQTPNRTYVIGLKVPKGSVKRANWWDTYDPYHYVRLEQKVDYDVLIVGGEDTSSDGQDRFLSQWIIYLIGPNPPLHDCYIITGDSGQGMTGGTIGGILIKDMILGHPNPWAKAYDPGRTPPISKKVGEKMGEETSHTIHGYKDRIPFMGTDSIDIEDMLPNSGGVIQKNMQKMAVYKDENGVVHKFSAVCPHMKCIIKWNPIDSTFDCPCHGSMFDNLGRIINGPAKADLSPFE